MANLELVHKQLKQERVRLAAEVTSLDKAIEALTKIADHGAGRGKGISVAGRARIAAAQRARWAKLKSGKAVAETAGRKRTLSASARARIRRAQKARWAKWRQEKKNRSRG